MLHPDKSNGEKSTNEDQFSPSNRSTHDEKYPYLTEFSLLISKLPMKELNELLTYQQKSFAKAIWEAENYGGSTAKCEKRLKELYGSKWYEVVIFEDHMADIREYYEFVLCLDHRLQWDKYKKEATILEDKDSQ